jgi:hypothetical protein
MHSTLVSVLSDGSHVTVERLAPQVLICTVFSVHFLHFPHSPGKADILIPIPQMEKPRLREL